MYRGAESIPLPTLTHALMSISSSGSPHLPEGAAGVGLCSQGAKDRTRGKSLVVPQGRFMSDIKESFFMERIEAAQGSGGETSPGGV